MNARKAIREVLLRALLLAGAAAGLGLAANAVRPQRLPWVGDWARHVEARARQEKIPLATLAALRQAVAQGTAVVLDARPMADYAAGHIPGAAALPQDQVADFLAVRLAAYDRRQALVTYCAGAECDEALQLALLLRVQGYTNLALFAGGLREWRETGGAVEAGP